MKIKNQFFFLVLMTYFSCQEKKESIKEEQQPNIIVVMTDDQGYGDLGVYGNELIKTPNLDKLHSQSVTFTNFHVGTTCAPTRAGLLSGAHCNRVGAWHTVVGRSFLSTRFPTIAEYLKEDGYATSIFGKWHLGDNYPFRPQDRGFDEVLIHGGGGVGQTPDLWNNDYFGDTYIHNGEPQYYEGYCTDVWFSEAMKEIEAKAKTGEPFFTYISTNSPHGPHHVPQKYIDMYGANEAVPNANFYGQISNIDDNMGLLEKTLKDNGLLDNTILIFLTDNGTASGAVLDAQQFVAKGHNANMRGKKGSEYEGGHRVPLFIRFPERMSIPKKEHSGLATYTDIVPTLLDILNIVPEKAKFDGVSLRGLIENGEDESLAERAVVVDTQRKDWPVKWKNSSVMLNDWRLINNKELYNISNDPEQRTDLFEQEPQLVKKLAAEYERWWDDFQEDIKQTNRIVVGSAHESPTLLTSHDWHTEVDPPWNQGQIRAGKVDNGFWELDLEKGGEYKIRLYRWPPSLKTAMNEDIVEGDPVEGGFPYKKGLGLNFISAKVEVQDQTMDSKSASSDTHFEFVANLESGVTQLQTWLEDEEGIVRGAYYVELEHISL